jgi:hypothetical protein
MDVKQQLQLKLENFEKCHSICDVDCPLGQLYDYTCALQNFVIQKIKDAQPKQEEKQPETKVESIG